METEYKHAIGVILLVLGGLLTFCRRNLLCGSYHVNFRCDDSYSDSRHNRFDNAILEVGCKTRSPVFSSFESRNQIYILRCSKVMYFFPFSRISLHFIESDRSN